MRKRGREGELKFGDDISSCVVCVCVCICALMTKSNIECVGLWKVHVLMFRGKDLYDRMEFMMINRSWLNHACFT